MRQWREGSKGEAERAAIAYPDYTRTRCTPCRVRVRVRVMAHAFYVYCMHIERTDYPPHAHGSVLYALLMHTVCTPDRVCTVRTPYIRTPVYIRTHCMHTRMSTVFAHHAWVQLHFGRLKQRQAALLGKPQHNFNSKL